MRTDSLKNITSKIGSGATPTGGGKAYKASGISLIRSQNVLDFVFSADGLAFIDEDQANGLANVAVGEGDILLNITGDSIARCCIVPSSVLPARVNQHVAIIRSKPDINNEYLFYYLQFLKPYLLKICGVGGTRNALTKEVLEKLPITILEHQSDIAKSLSLLDRKIKLNCKISSELESLAMTLYNYWFVQFDFPNEHGKPYKSSGGAMEWNEELKREIPKGWKVVEAQSLLDVRDGTHDSPKPSNAGFHLITSKHLTQDGIDFENAYLISPTDYHFVNKRSKVDTSDILISMIGTIGLMYFVLDKEVQFAIKNIGLFKTSKNPKLAEFIYLTIRSIYGQGYFRTNKSGSIQKYLTLDVLRTLPVLHPNSDQIAQFKSKVEPVFQKIHHNNLENNELIHMRSFLLPLLMNGQVKIKSLGSSPSMERSKQSANGEGHTAVTPSPVPLQSN